MEKESRSNASFPHSLLKDWRLHFYEASVLIDTAQRLYTPKVGLLEYTAYKCNNGVFFKVNLNNLRSLLILGGVLISFEIMINFARNSRFKFSDCLFYCITTPSPLFPATSHISNLKCLLRFSYRLLFSCIWDPGSPCVSYSSY